MHILAFFYHINRHKKLSAIKLRKWFCAINKFIWFQGELFTMIMNFYFKAEIYELSWRFLQFSKIVIFIINKYYKFS